MRTDTQSPARERGVRRAIRRTVDRGFPPAALSFDTLALARTSHHVARRSALKARQYEARSRNAILDAAGWEPKRHKSPLKRAEEPVGSRSSTGPKRTGLTESSHVNVALAEDSMALKCRNSSRGSLRAPRYGDSSGILGRCSHTAAKHAPSRVARLINMPVKKNREWKATTTSCSPAGPATPIRA